MYLKETKNGVITGVLCIPNAPESEDYIYTEIEESEYESVKASMTTDTPNTEPTLEDYLLDLDYRVSCIELGL